MDRTVERLMSQAVTGARNAISMADDLETMFEMWSGYMLDRLGEEVFLSRLQTFDDHTFNLDGYQPTIMPVSMNMIDGMTSIGLDVIRPTPMKITAETNTMVLEEVKDLVWLLFTVTEQGHPLKGLRYVCGWRNKEITLSLDDPAFTTTYSDEECQTGCRGIFIDKKDRFLRQARKDIFE